MYQYVPNVSAICNVMWKRNCDVSCDTWCLHFHVNSLKDWRWCREGCASTSGCDSGRSQDISTSNWTSKFIIFFNPFVFYFGGLKQKLGLVHRQHLLDRNAFRTLVLSCDGCVTSVKINLNISNKCLYCAINRNASCLTNHVKMHMDGSGWSKFCKHLWFMI